MISDLTGTTTVSGGYVVHPVAAMFPLITGSEFEQFVEDIRTNGQMDPVVLDAKGQLIDGRNRMRACIAIGINPKTKVYEGDDVTKFIVSHNIHRRHLTDSQRAMIAAKLATHPPHRTKDERTEPYGSVPAESSPTLADASALLNVSRQGVVRAKAVMRDGLPELQDLVSEGHASVSTAARVAQENFPQQKKYVDEVRAGADPVKAAPPDKESEKRRHALAPKDNKPALRPTGTKHVSVLDTVTSTMRVWRENVLTFTGLDSSVTKEEATRLTDDLSKSITALRQINQLLKERTNA